MLSSPGQPYLNFYTFSVDFFPTCYLLYYLIPTCHLSILCETARNWPYDHFYIIYIHRTPTLQKKIYWSAGAFWRPQLQDRQLIDQP